MMCRVTNQNYQHGHLHVLMLEVITATEQLEKSAGNLLLTVAYA